MRFFKVFFIFLACVTAPLGSEAHPMPNSSILLEIGNHHVKAELQLPLNELELAFGHDVNYNSDKLIERLGPQLKSYILKHLKVVSNRHSWMVEVISMEVRRSESGQGLPYNELRVFLLFRPPGSSGIREFYLNYDVIMHQVITHYALVSVRQDWDNGSSAELPREIGVIRASLPEGKILPLHVNIGDGSLWKGFTSMVSLGISHIREGTDHLLFLLTLLLPSTLTVSGKRWGDFGGIRYSLNHIIRIVTAFTIGHSITLLAGASGLINFPAQPIEVLIALSIFISAVHAFRPVFPGREMYVAAGFGLIHGMAFAETLVNLDLDAGRMALSILGFNLGIELMQLLIIFITIPWLIILSRNGAYTALRISGSLFAGIASIAWVAERITQKTNSITMSVQAAASHSLWFIILLAAAACASYFKLRKINPNS